MANIAAIEKAIMTTTDEKMLKQMAESMTFDIYQQLSPEARGRLAKRACPVYGEVPASSPPPFGTEQHTQRRTATYGEADRYKEQIIAGKELKDTQIKNIIYLLDIAKFDNERDVEKAKEYMKILIDKLSQDDITNVAFVEGLSTKF